jgi:hypothetical protein
MDAQLDLDDVSATSELAKQELAALRADNQRMREALKEAKAWMIDGMSSYKWLEAYKVISAGLGEE